MPINHTEHFEFQNDSDESIKLMLQAICPILFGKVLTTQYSQLWLRTKEGPSYWNDGSEYKCTKKTLPTRLWIATIGHYKTEKRPDDITGTLEEIINHAHTALVDARKNRRDEFEQVCGDGYNSCCKHFDGTVDVTYFMCSSNRVWRELHLALTHGYYGK